MRGFIHYFPSAACCERLLPSRLDVPTLVLQSLLPVLWGGFLVPPKLMVGRFGLPKSSEFSVVIIILFRGSPQLSRSKPG